MYPLADGATSLTRTGKSSLPTLPGIKDSDLNQYYGCYVFPNLIKWAVYALLLIDFVIYIIQDARSAPFTLPENPAIVDWASAYTTSIDLAAWFVLIAFFELETWVLSDRVWKGAVKWIVRGGRLFCYICILHTTVADTRFLTEFYTAERLQDVPDLCGYTGDDWSFLKNRGYTYIDENNCAALAEGSAHFVIGADPVITDRAGLREGLILAWTDLIENISWLLVILINEVVVRNYVRIVGSPFLKRSNRLKIVLYSTIVCIACYWLSKNQILYFYDELLWVGGFLAIEGNLNEWRRELLATRGAKGISPETT